MTDYAELAVTTNFSFLRGASHPQEMVAAAEALRLAAIGIADRNSFAGVVRAFGQWKKIVKEKRTVGLSEDQARQTTVKLIVGTRLITADGFEAIAYPTDRKAYGRLCRLLTLGNRRAKKGECHIFFEDILAAGEGQVFIAVPPEAPGSDFIARLVRLAAGAPDRTFLAGIHRHRGDEPRRLGQLDELGRKHGTPLVAVNDVHYHVPERRILADVVTCIREKCQIAEAGLRLAVNEERHLKPPQEMARRRAPVPEPSPMPAASRWKS
jgi:error-prone DNA polymerase